MYQSFSSSAGPHPGGMDNVNQKAPHELTPLAPKTGPHLWGMDNRYQSPHEANAQGTNSLITHWGLTQGGWTTSTRKPPSS